jgi:hypothetical protein
MPTDRHVMMHFSRSNTSGVAGNTIANKHQCQPIGFVIQKSKSKMSHTPPPSSPTPAMDSDGEDDDNWKRRRDDADQRSTNVFDALVHWSQISENHHEGCTVSGIALAEHSASFAYRTFRDRMPEYHDGESEDAAVHAYNAYCHTLVATKKKRRLRDSSGQHDKSQQRKKRMSSTAVTGNIEKGVGPAIHNDVP